MLFNKDAYKTDQMQQSSQSPVHAGSHPQGPRGSERNREP